MIASLAGHLVRREAQPHREADQDVAENAAEESLAEAERDLGLADPDRGLHDRAVAERERTGPEHHQRAAQRADEVGEVDQAPVARELQARDLALGPGHDDQVVAGEQLRPADHHQDQAEGEREAAKQARRPETELAAGHHQSEEHRTERDERAG